MIDDDHVIHQLVHGYARGHRLLAASTELSGEIGTLISRASDAAPNYRPSTGPYLTGYPLPNGGWALARTWPAPDAERPNTVWTHTLLVPAPLVGRVNSASLSTLFRRPAAVPSGESLSPVDPTSLPTRRAFAPRTAARAAASVYLHDAVVIGQGPFTVHERDETALALWDQHWTTIRRTLAFCTAPDVSLFGPQARSVLFTAKGRDQEPAAMPDVVIDDLCERTAFRKWVHFVGSGEHDPALIVVFAQLYGVLRKSDAEAETLRQAENLLAAAGPAAEQLRRLKRRLLAFEHGRPSWSVPPTLLLEALVHERLGAMTAADDASLDKWIALAWDADPQRTAHVLASAHRQDTDAGSSNDGAASGMQVARDAISEAFEQSMSRLVTPATVESFATLAPERLMAALIDRDDVALWKEWATLEPEVRRSTLGGLRENPPCWDHAIRGAREEPGAVRALLEVAPVAVRSLLDLLTNDVTPSDRDFYPLPAAATRLLRDDVTAASKPQRIRAVAHIADTAHLPKRVEWRAWERALRRYRDDEVVAAVAYLLGRRADDVDGLELAAIALGRLYPALAMTEARAAWTRLGDRITGDRGNWDRCHRLVDDFARAVGKHDPDIATKLVGKVLRASPDAAVALTDALHHKRSDNIWKAVTDLFRF